ncbi:MAG: DUF1127 domain-containing protein [Pseudomonadota bacterium]|nr:DUF1127 domain-containing protein [Pseudomonadota bacterium]
MSDIAFVVARSPLDRPEQGPSLLARLHAHLIARQTRRMLTAMDDRALADIGACRPTPVWEDNRPISERIDTLR